MIDSIFDACVQFLLALATWTGMTYKEVNVWIFVVLWPLLTAVMAVWIFLLRRRIKSLELRLPSVEGASRNQ